jgi:hypothetical protein
LTPAIHSIFVTLHAWRVLAIDTALAACAATVLDTDHGIVASESLPMVRGHAEALIPLWSRTTKHASNSSTDHGGGKRRAVNLALWLRDGTRPHPLSVLTKRSPFTQRSPMGSIIIESAVPILSASATAAFLASSTVLKSPVGAASKAGIAPGSDGLAK